MATAAVPRRARRAEIIHRRAAVRRFLVIIEMVTAAVKSNTPWIFDSETPARDVEGVNAVVREFAAAPVPPPVPVVMHQVIDVRALRRGALPERVVQIFRHRHLFTAAD